MIELRKNLAVIAADTQPEFAAWLDAHAGQVFRLKPIRGDGYLQSLGPEEEACHLPLNITSKAPGELKLISNFAFTPFVLDDIEYGSVEAFWQSLKFPDESKRREIAPLHGSRAKDSGFYAPSSDTLIFRDALVRIGTWDHWQLMAEACTAKFNQNERARKALLSTGRRPLAHQMRQDSRTIPGVIMAEIWMKCRSGFAGCG